jgi:hypothetical protein
VCPCAESDSRRSGRSCTFEVRRTADLCSPRERRTGRRWVRMRFPGRPESEMDRRPPSSRRRSDCARRDGDVDSPALTTREHHRRVRPARP